ncbi:hypothetical protein MFMK1_000851 [Metallumcola ferriviriculae]|uniref:Uncharacterized protein n=1 Tax=Metallumcola ferriviriculae TaxID=3039180 RepID=A0AAU0UKK4_9FIRM|nr:hypothetical protein MFMK1_000851 [Desulfitibacteraceae bacterium MK1]
MDEKTKADIYLEYLEQILSGKKDIGHVEDVEIEKLLLLAKTMVAAEISINNETRENLKKRLLAQVTKNNKSRLSVLSRNDDELDEEDLEYVAAGFGGQSGEQNNICPFCGARFNKIAGKCSFCNR